MRIFLRPNCDKWRLSWKTSRKFVTSQLFEDLWTSTEKLPRKKIIGRKTRKNKSIYSADLSCSLLGGLVQNSILFKQICQLICSLLVKNRNDVMNTVQKFQSFSKGILLSDPGKPGVRSMSPDVTESKAFVTLADEDTNWILTDNANGAIQGNVAMQVMRPGGQLWKQFKWRHLMTKFWTNACCA